METKSQILPLEKLQDLAELPAPIVGIPIPGVLPWAGERRTMATLINGLNGETRVELFPAGNGHGTHPLLSIVAPGRSYKLIGRGMAQKYGHCTAWVGSLSSLMPKQAQWGKRQRAQNGKAHVDRWGEPEGTPAAKLAKTVPPFLRKELRDAEKRLPYMRPFEPDRGELFRWLHPRLPELPSYGMPENGDFRKLTRAEAVAELARDLQAQRNKALKWYQAKPRRREIGKVVAGYFVKLGRVHDFNGLRKRLKAIGLTVKPWSAQPVAVRKIRNYDPGESERPAYQLWHKPEGEAQAHFVKNIAPHLGIRKPRILYAWPNRPADGASAVAQHHTRRREYRALQARVNALRAQIAACERGDPVAFEDAASEN